MGDRLIDAESVINALLNTIEYRRAKGEKVDMSYAVSSALGNYLRNHRPEYWASLKFAPAPEARRG